MAEDKHWTEIIKMNQSFLDTLRTLKGSPTGFYLADAYDLYWQYHWQANEIHKGEYLFGDPSMQSRVCGLVNKYVHLGYLTKLDKGWYIWNDELDDKGRVIITKDLPPGTDNLRCIGLSTCGGPCNSDCPVVRQYKAS